MQDYELAKDNLHELFDKDLISKEGYTNFDEWYSYKETQAIDTSN